VRIALDVTAALARGTTTARARYAARLAASLLEVATPDDRLLLLWKLSRWRRLRALPRLDDARVRARPFVGAAAPLILRGCDVFHGLRTDLPRRTGRCPAAFTVHSLDWVLHPGLGPPEGRDERRARMTALAGRADGLLVQTEAGRRALLEAFPATDPARVFVTPLGCDAAEFSPDPAPGDPGVRERLGLRTPYVVCVATVEKRKNQARLARAFARAKAARGLVLALAGGRGYGAEEALAEVGPHVRVLGPVAPADLPALYRGASAFALPSLYDEAPLALIEAMACGCPAVAGATGTVAELADGAAELVDPISEEAIAAGLERALADPARRAELRERGLRRAGALTWRACAERTYAVYGTLAAMGPRRP